MHGPEEIAKGVRAFAVLAKDQGLISGTHTEIH